MSKYCIKFKKTRISFVVQPNWTFLDKCESLLKDFLGLRIGFSDHI